MVALKEMGSDHVKGMLSHISVKEIMVLRKLDHPNIASASRVHFNSHIYDFSHFDPTKKNFCMYIEMEKAKFDLCKLTRNP